MSEIYKNISALFNTGILQKAKKDTSVFLVVDSYMTRSQVIELVFFGIKVADRPPEHSSRHKGKDAHHAVVPDK